MKKKILVVGASGYIASRLIPVLLQQGHDVRCLVREPKKLSRRSWIDLVEVIQADVTDEKTLPSAVNDRDVIYYLVHNMSSGKEYDRLDLLSAKNLGNAAAKSGVKRIIYLGGLADRHDEQLARHLYSRIETGDTLRESGIQVIEFRSGVIIGAGSVSFEMIRGLADQFHVLIGPLWLRNKTQPAAISDVIGRLLDALDIDNGQSLTADLGSDEVFTYIEIMMEYAKVTGKKRLNILLPFIPPRLMAFFISLLTPVTFDYALPLVQGLKNNSLVQHPLKNEHFPGLSYLPYRQALALAIEETNPDGSGRIWLDSGKQELIGLYSGLAVHYKLFSSSQWREAIVLGEDWQSRWLSNKWRKICHEANNDKVRFEYEHQNIGKLWLEVQPVSLNGEIQWERTILLRPTGIRGYFAYYLYRLFPKFDQH